MAAYNCWCGQPPFPHAWGAGCPRSGPVLPVSQVELNQPQRTVEKGGHRYVADVYHGGGRREENGDRPRFDLLWTKNQPLERQMLHRDAVWYQKGADKYGERNWERFDGPAELVRAQASLGRHYAAFMLGLTDEDHAAAVRANVQFIEYIRERLAEQEPDAAPPSVPCGNPNQDCGMLGGHARCGRCSE